MPPHAPIIRPYRSADRAPLVDALLRSEPWITLGFGPGDWAPVFDRLDDQDTVREAVVGELDGQVTGLAVVRRGFLLGDYLELLMVSPGARGRGVGSTLLLAMEEKVFARSRNFFLCVSDFNAEGRAFYTRHGYEDVGPIRDLLVSGRAEILMRKSIGPARGKA